MQSESRGTYKIKINFGLSRKTTRKARLGQAKQRMLQRRVLSNKLRGKSTQRGWTVSAASAFDDDEDHQESDQTNSDSAEFNGDGRDDHSDAENPNEDNGGDNDDSADQDASDGQGRQLGEGSDDDGQNRKEEEERQAAGDVEETRRERARLVRATLNRRARNQSSGRPSFAQKLRTMVSAKT